MTRRAADTDFPLVVVVGHPAYYPRFGFEPADTLGIAAPFAVPAEAWMVHRLPAYRRDARGTVVYPEAFAGLTIIVAGTLHVDPSDRDAYLAARVPILEHARAAPGCLDFSLTADLLDSGRINVYERWESHEHLLAYRDSDGPEEDDSIALTGADVRLHHIASSEAP